MVIKIMHIEYAPDAENVFAIIPPRSVPNKLPLIIIAS